MKRLKPITVGLAFATGLGAGVFSLPQSGWTQDEDVVVKLRVPRAKPGTVEDKTETAKPDTEQLVAEADTAKPDEEDTEADEAAAETDDGDAASSESPEKEEKTMSDEKPTERTAEEQEVFKQTMHEGDVALGVCGARLSALLWFYEASVAQGRDDLKTAVASLSESREAIKAEAERRAVDDKVDTSVRVMNSESEKIWNDLNEKAGGDEEEFQKAHDELFAGVQECLALFFERPEKAEEDAAKE